MSFSFSIGQAEQVTRLISATDLHARSHQGLLFFFEALFLNTNMSISEQGVKLDQQPTLLLTNTAGYAKLHAKTTKAPEKEGWLTKSSVKVTEKRQAAAWKRMLTYSGLLGWGGDAN